MRKKIQLWIVTDEKIGNLNPALGMAEAIQTRLSATYATEIICKTIFLKRIFRFFPVGTLLHFPFSPAFLLKYCFYGDSVAKEIPDIVIGNGRSVVEACALIKKNSLIQNKPCFAIQLQHPHIHSDFYDCVIPPEHDQMTGHNVLPIIGSITRITKKTLTAPLPPELTFLQALPCPRLAIMIGGKSKNYDLTDDIVEKLCCDLVHLSQNYGYSLMITASRRTTAMQKETIKNRLKNIPHCYIWNDENPNPYSAFLSLADAFIITADSVNMISDAVHTGKPVFMYPLQGNAGKFMTFYKALYQKNVMAPFSVPLHLWTVPAFNETQRIADLVVQRLEKFWTANNNDSP